MAITRQQVDKAVNAVAGRTYETLTLQDITAIVLDFLNEVEIDVIGGFRVDIIMKVVNVDTEGEEYRWKKEGEAIFDGTVEASQEIGRMVKALTEVRSCPGGDG